MSTRSRGASSIEYALLLVAVMIGGAAAVRLLGRTVAARTLQAARVLDGEEAPGSGERAGGSSVLDIHGRKNGLFQHCYSTNRGILRSYDVDVRGRWQSSSRRVA